jgi:hypothetical protein
MIGFLYLSARVHSCLQVERESTLSRVITKIRLSQARMASANCSSQSIAGFRSRLSTQARSGDGPDSNARMSFSAKSRASAEE